MTARIAPQHAVESAWAAQRKKLQQPTTLALFKQYKLRPTAALRNRIVELNLGLVRKEARAWAEQCSVPLEDLRQEGVLGLIKAVEKYDLASGNAFSSFAVPYINGAIQHFLRDRGWGTVRPPRRTVEEYAKVTKTQRILAQQGRELPLEEVAAGLGMTQAKWRFVQEAREQKPVLSLDEEPLQLAAPGPEVEEDLGWVYEHLEGLSELGRNCVVEKIFGKLSDQEIASRRGLCAAAVQILIAQSLEQMRAEIVQSGRMG